MDELTLQFDDMIEAFLRRHVIVHNGGRVDQRYLDALPKSIPKPSPGDRLFVDAAYLTGVFDLLLAVGGGLTCLWLYKLKGSKKASGQMVHVVALMLERQSWADAELLVDHFTAITEDPEDVGRLEVNRWMAQRQQAGSVDAISAAVKAWTPPDDKEYWEVARHALLLDLRGTEKHLRKAIADGMAPATFASWPLLNQFSRKHPDLMRLLQGRGGGGLRP